MFSRIYNFSSNTSQKSTTLIFRCQNWLGILDLICNRSYIVTRLVGTFIGTYIRFGEMLYKMVNEKPAGLQLRPLDTIRLCSISHIIQAAALSACIGRDIGKTPRSCWQGGKLDKDARRLTVECRHLDTLTIWQHRTR
jgi:hypothetical protein